jgi:signal transduction histidine kinase
LIRGDYVQLALLISNLLENAAKYSPPDREVLICLHAQPDSVLVIVRDFGQGVSAGEESHIFERFYRGKRELAAGIHGTGLGLALCKAVAVAHGGRIWAANAPRNESPGAIFHLELPVS